MILENIKSFNKQFGYIPEIKNAERLGKKYKKYFVCGMGGSHLSADLLKIWRPDIDIVIWNDYGIPYLSKEDKENSLFIASSYSGNTEETISAFIKIKEANLPLAVVSSGGELISLAKSFSVPYILLPNDKMQPRMALGYSIKALLTLIGEKKSLEEISKLEFTLNTKTCGEVAKKLSKKLNGFVPIIYSSFRNEALAQNWKIVLNETGKIPAFYNVFPELNHNEMTGFDSKKNTQKLSSKFYFVILKDSEDDQRIIKRMNILEKLLKLKKFNIISVNINGKNRIEKIFSSINTAQWLAFYTSALYKGEPEQVPMVEDFKKMMTQ
jgi:glucose/mannose-6-phosphate isomerase